jgi:hypothetical protein
LPSSCSFLLTAELTDAHHGWLTLSPPPSFKFTHKAKFITNLRQDLSPGFFSYKVLAAQATIFTYIEELGLMCFIMILNK